LARPAKDLAFFLGIGPIAAIPGRAGQRHALAGDPELGMRRHNFALGPQTLISG
jgi:hypothetical protein